MTIKHLKGKRARFTGVLLIIAMLLSLLPAEVSAESGIEITVTALKENEDSSSMMSSMLSSVAVLEQEDGQNYVSVTFVAATIAGVSVTGSAITGLTVYDSGGDAMDATDLGSDNETGTHTFRFAVGDLVENNYVKADLKSTIMNASIRFCFFSEELGIGVEAEEENVSEDSEESEEESSNSEEDASESTIDNGYYTVSVTPLQETSDAESMMAPVLDDTAVLKVNNNNYTVTIKFIKATIMGLDINGSTVSEIWPEPVSTPTTTGTGITGTYDASDESQSYTFSLSTLDLPTLAMYVGSPMNGIRIVRLSFDLNSLEKTGELDSEEPDPDTEPVQTIAAVSGSSEVSIETINGITGSGANLGFDFDDTVISFPVKYLRTILEDSPSASAIQIKKDAISSSNLEGISLLLDDNETLVSSLELTLSTISDSGDVVNSVSDFEGEVRILIHLTEDQINALTEAQSYYFSYYNPESDNLEDVTRASFDTSEETAVFYTDHFSSYALISTANETVTETENTSGTTSSNYADGTYTIKAVALQESSDSKSMVNQFIKDRLQLDITDDVIEVTMLWHGTDEISMSSVKELKYLNQSGKYVNAGRSLDASTNSMEITFTIYSLDEVVMQAYVPEGMGETKPVFRIVFDEDTLKTGTVDFSSNLEEDYDFTIRAAAGDGGTISPKGKVGVNSGKKMTFTITADTGYLIDNVLIDGTSAGPLETYTFENVTTNHAISAAFLYDGINAFQDVSSHWAYPYIKFAVQKQLLNGTSDSIFSPNTPMTRGMFVTVLGRLSEVDTGKYTNTDFRDVASGKYYAPYVAWAAENKIASGTGAGSFSPDKELSREEAAAIFAAYKTYAQISSDGAVKVQETTDSAIEVKLEDGSYGIEAAALKIDSKEASMADQMIKDTMINVSGKQMTATVLWQGTEAMTADMVKELKYKKADGTFVDTGMIFDKEANTLSFTLPVESLSSGTVLQVYVPDGMGEARPEFRMVFNTETLTKRSAESFGDGEQISTWAVSAVAQMRAAGLLVGDTENKFRPKQVMTRAEVAVLLSRSMGFNQ